MKYFRYIVYALVAVGFSSALAGSFDDFFIAIRNDNASKLSSLLDRGFDPNTRDDKGQPGLTVAMREHAPKTAALLLARPETDVNSLNPAGESALMIAAIKGNLDDAKLLLDHGAQVNQPGWSPLHYAASGPESSVVKLLLDKGANIDAESPNGTTPLMMAAQYGSEDNVEVLLARGADAKRKNQKGLTAVDFARTSDRAPLVKRLEAAQR
jgi:uncharacterized protein